jgi:hypothetical protein
MNRNCSRAQIEAVEHNINGDHHRYDHEPDGFHGYRTSTIQTRRIDLFTQLRRHNRLRTVLDFAPHQEQEEDSQHRVHPQEAQQREQALPAETIFE